MSLSSAPSTSSHPIVDLPLRAVARAASFIRFSSSAPEKPGVRRDIDEYLIDRLLPLVVPAGVSGAALPPHGIDLVEEDYAGGVLLRLEI